MGLHCKRYEYEWVIDTLVINTLNFCAGTRLSRRKLVHQMVKFWGGAGPQKRQNIDSVFLAITHSKMFGFIFSKHHVKALDEIFHLASFLANLDKM